MLNGIVHNGQTSTVPRGLEMSCPQKKPHGTIYPLSACVFYFIPTHKRGWNRGENKMEPHCVEEVWADFWNGYCVSTCGRLKNRHGRVIRHHTNPNGYPIFKYRYKGRYKGRKSVVVLVHRQIASLFLIKKEVDTQVNHKDRDRTNNHLSNLEWCTAKENMHHWIYEKDSKGMLRAKKIKQLLDSGVSARGAAKIVGVSPALAQAIKQNLIWRGRLD